MAGGRKNTVLFGSVIYEDALQYFNEFADCINRQTADSFSVVLFNDGISPEELRSRTSAIRKPCRIIECAAKSTPSQLRVSLIREAKALGAEILITGDADDLFSENRMENTIKIFEKNPSVDFVYNELRLFDGDIAMPEIPEQVSDIKEIAEYNFLGMSNTAIRVGRLGDSFIDSLTECSTFVFDWYLYTSLLLAGYRGIKAKEAYTLYRVHEKNCVGLPEETEEAVEKEIEVKTRHYELLRRRDSLFENLYDCYKSGRIKKVALGGDKQSCHYWWNFTRAEKAIY